MSLAPPLDLCILGAGATGLSLLLLLKEAGISLTGTAIVDPHFDGGDLARKWTAVASNTPWSKTYNALRAACPSLPLSSSKDPEASTPLVEIAEFLRTTAAPVLRLVRQIQGQATQLAWSEGCWTVSVVAKGKIVELRARNLVLAVGSEPRAFDLPIPSIPLEIALDGGRMRHYVRQGQKVLVFGTMHSGTLVIRNAVESGAKVTGLYNTETPFVWDRDGAYDGIKREAADIADAIVAGNLACDLVHVQDTSAVIRASIGADWVVYAMGFATRDIPCTVDAQPRSTRPYNGATGVLTELPSAWGFGTAYPNRAPDGVHWDVSVAAFLSHMASQLPALIAAIQAK